MFSRESHAIRLTESNRRVISRLRILFDAEMNPCWIVDVFGDSRINEGAHEYRKDPENVRPEKPADRGGRPTEPSNAMGWGKYQPSLEEVRCTGKVSCRRWRHAGQ